MTIRDEAMPVWRNLWDLRGQVYLGISNESRDAADRQAEAQTSVASWMKRTACVKVSRKL